MYVCVSIDPFNLFTCTQLLLLPIQGRLQGKALCSPEGLERLVARPVVPAQWHAYYLEAAWMVAQFPLV